MAQDDREKAGLSRRNFLKGAATGAAAAAAGGTLLGGADAARAPPPPPGALCVGPGDVALINGNFLTMDANNSVVSAVTIRGGRIAEVGSVGTLGPCAPP